MSIKLHYETLGEGEPLIILHGLFGSHRNWRAIAKQLASQFKVYCVDLRNHGDSDHAESMNYKDMSEDIRHFLTANQLEEISILGHSMGGKVAMTFALSHAELVKQIVVLDIAPVRYENEYVHLIDAMLKLDMNVINSRNQANDLLRTDIVDDTIRMFLLQNLLVKEDKYYWRINLQAIKSGIADISDFPVFEDEIHYKRRALFLGGEESTYIQNQHQQMIQRYFPDSNIVQIPSAGHWLHADQPERVLQEITRFLTA